MTVNVRKTLNDIQLTHYDGSRIGLVFIGSDEPYILVEYCKRAASPSPSIRRKEFESQVHLSNWFQ